MAPGRFLLGIDAGGTFTDAVLLRDQSGDSAERVAASVKVPTTHDDLSRCVSDAIAQVLADSGTDARQVDLISVATTLATNALVEGNLRPAALVAIGFERAALTRAGIARVLSPEHVVCVAGGHNAHGEERAPLDETALAEALDRVDPAVEGYAVAAQFAVRNPVHEAAARELIAARSDKPLTCSHELSPKLGGPQRALTAALNACLVPLVRRFVDAVAATADRLGLEAPLMVVRGDGSLVTATFARQRPIEMILSGPAAGALGAAHLAAAASAAGGGAVMVADIGGTTTDLTVVDDGVPTVPADGAGAVVGGYATMVRAIAVTTVGIGGDSDIRVPVEPPPGAVTPSTQARRAPDLEVGPRRVLPLCRAALEHPELIRSTLERQLQADVARSDHARFVLATGSTAGTSGNGHAAGQAVGLPKAERELLERLAAEGGAAALDQLDGSARARAALARVVRQGLVVSAGFTPTDACVVLGLMEGADAEAALLGARVLARTSDRLGRPIAGDAQQLCRHVLDAVTKRASESVLRVALAHDGLPVGDAATAVVSEALARTEQTMEPSWPAEAEAAPAESDAEPVRAVSLRAGLAVPLVAIGAPAGTLAPRIAALLGTDAVVPLHAEIAGAVGAVVGRIRVVREATITAPRRGSYLVHTDEGAPPTYHDRREAVAHATDHVRRAAELEIRAAGAAEFEIVVDITTRSADVDGHDLFVESTVRATATGRTGAGRPGERG
ncbi:MAG TPA: hydantoinase [Acidimicrobiaceae bacterium]|nr:hydantoinase [Acidimicrobiaceae bacterium]HCB36866.1 hydantoinase [Acidimicrobiaceae bacterium]